MAKNADRTISTPRIIIGDDRPNPWLWLLVLAGLGVWTWQVYEFGLQYPGPDPSVVAAQENQLLLQIADLERQRDELRARSAQFERASQIDRQATLAVQEQIRLLREERAELARQAAHLRSLVSDGDSTFEISDYALYKVAANNEFRYTFTLSRQVEGAKKVEGLLTVNIAGQMDGEFTELPMTQVASDGQQAHKLGFKQFQKIEGRLRVPASFAPSELLIDVRLTAPKPRAFINAFDWVWTES